MKTEIRFEGGTLTVLLCGDIDHHAASSIRREIDREMAEKMPHTLVMDLTKTDFMDSSGLGLILGRKQKTLETGGEMILKNPSEAVTKLLRLAGVQKLISIVYE